MASKKKQKTVKARLAPKRKTFLHKEAVFSKEQGKSFEDILRQALLLKEQVAERMQDGTSEGEKRFINYHLLHSKDNKPIFGCEFLAFEKGSDQSVIEMQPGVKELSVDAVPAGTDREFVGGSVYFGIRKNHIIFFQSMGLRSVELEAYFNWLLRECAKVIDSETFLFLKDHISNNTRQKIKGVKGIKLSSPLMQHEPVVEKSEAAATTDSLTIVPKGGKWDALKAFLGGVVDLPDKIKLADLTQMQDVEIQIFLRWRGHHGVKDDNAFLDSIATQMRHVTDEFDYSVESRNGSYSKDKLKIKKDYSVEWTDSGRPKFDMLFPKMATWLETLINDGKVTP